MSNSIRLSNSLMVAPYYQVKVEVELDTLDTMGCVDALRRVEQRYAEALVSAMTPTQLAASAKYVECSPIVKHFVDIRRGAKMMMMGLANSTAGDLNDLDSAGL